jgi:hypothetical protein
MIHAGRAFVGSRRLGELYRHRPRRPHDGDDCS